MRREAAGPAQDAGRHGVAARAPSDASLKFGLGLFVLAVGVALAVKPSLGFLAVVALAAIAVSVWRPVAATIGYLGFVLVQDLLLNFTLDPSLGRTILKRADEGILLLLVLTTIAARRPRILRASYPAGWALLIAMGIGAISTLVYAERFALAAFDAFLLVKGFLMFFVVINLPLRKSAIERVFAAILCAGVACLGAAVADLVFGDSYRVWLSHPRLVDYRGGLPTVVAIFENQGLSGWFFAFCACVAWAGWLVRRKALYLILSLAMVAGSMTSLRRKPLAGMLLVFVVAPLLTGKSRGTVRSVVTALLIIGIMGYAMGDTIVLIYGDLLDEYVYAPDPMSVARNAMLLTSIQVARDHFPLGAGFGRFGGWIAALYYSPLYFEYGLNTVGGLSENSSSFLQDVFWPHIIGQLGVIGGTAFLLALLLLIRPLLRPPAGESDAARMLRLAAVFCFLEAIPESFGWMVFEHSLAAAGIFGLLALSTMQLSAPAEDRRAAAQTPAFMPRSR